ncbi:MAG: NnrS family protein [Burkholderiales bacterium RIFCSPLOWO2_12_FULL_61_40]|nr:MAG: NnrS family protein [Burkholderiales bacterium RIFCSPLOWO2_12_FULL_61_40]
MLNQIARPPVPVWHTEHPLWLCGFRPFFLFTALAAPLLIGLWSLFLATGIPLPTVAGGPFTWHAHELIFGFGLAAVAGFVLTGIPEFTDTAAFGAPAVRRLAGLWLLGRIAFWCSGLFGHSALLLAALAHLGLLGGLAAMLWPRLWRDPQRRHLAFFWGLAALIACVAGFYVDALRGVYPGRWLYAALGVLMVLIVLAMSRISMRIVNGALDEAGVAGVHYRARPPRRHLAIFFIAIYTVAEFFAPGERLGGWLALAAAAALFNLLNDWHIGRALFRRWPLMLYGVYVLMALGYATMGLSLVLGGSAFSAGRHLLTTGALGLNIYGVMCIAGRMHCGLPLDERLWVPAGAVALVAAALMRAGAAWPGVDSRFLLVAAGLSWGAAFALYAWYMAPLFLTPRADGGRGCEGVTAGNR